MDKNNFERKWIKIDNCRIAYRQWGKEGEPIVLLHGFPMNSMLWHQTGLHLSKHGYLVFAPEMLGLGFTEGPEDYDHSLYGQANLLNRFINLVIQKECILVGHDLGGGIAQIIMTDFPSSVKKSVLTSSVAFDSWPIEGVKILIKYAFQENYSQIFTYDFVSGILRKGLAAGLLNPAVITPEFLEDICLGLTGTKERVNHFVRFLRAMDNKYTRKASPLLQKFKREVLLVWAKDDYFQPIIIGEKLKNVLPEATWKVINGKHFHPLESNDLADAILLWGKPSFNF